MTFVSVCSQPSWVDNTVQPQGLLGNHRLSPSFPVCDLSHIEFRMSPSVFMSYWTTGLSLIEINNNHIIKTRLTFDVYCSPRFLYIYKNKTSLHVKPMAVFFTLLGPLVKQKCLFLYWNRLMMPSNSSVMLSSQTCNDRNVVNAAALLLPVAVRVVIVSMHSCASISFIPLKQLWVRTVLQWATAGKIIPFASWMFSGLHLLDC